MTWDQDQNCYFGDISHVTYFEKKNLVFKHLGQPEGVPTSIERRIVCGELSAVYTMHSFAEERLLNFFKSSVKKCFSCSGNRKIPGMFD